MHHTQSTTELTAVLVEPAGSQVSVWLRRNIATTTIEIEEGLSQTVWEADEVCGTMPAGTTAEQVAADFDAIWEVFDRGGLSDQQRDIEVQREIAGASSVASHADVQAWYTGVMTDTLLDE